MERPSLDQLRPAHLAELDRRYGAILAAHHLDAVVLHSGVRRLRREFDDQYWPLVPLAPFAHWLPLAQPDCLVVVRPGQRPRLVRFVDDSFWEQAPVDEVAPTGFEVIEVRDPAAARAHLPSGRVALVGAVEAAVAGAFAADALNPPALCAALDRSRVTKTPYELACLAEANRRAAAGHRATVENFAARGLSELELHLAYLAATSQDDPETPYKNIVATGANAATLHHVTYRRASEPSATSLLLDAGATCRGYASDVTRTHVRGAGEAADRFRALVDGMEAMQQRLCAAITVGAPYQDLHDRSHHELAGVMRAIGLGRAGADELVATGVTRAFYPHGLGHALGLQTHDVGCAELKPRADNPFLRNTSTIAVGQVFTIEPGIYFIRSLLEPLRHGPHAAAVDWRVADALAPFGGVRIEDDLAVTDGGSRNLTREAFAGNG